MAETKGRARSNKFKHLERRTGQELRYIAPNEISELVNLAPRKISELQNASAPSAQEEFFL
jgi:hypothetical protein